MGNGSNPPLKEAMREARFEDIRKSITRRQNTVTQYIATQLIMDLYERTTQGAGARVSRRCWGQEVIDFKAAKERSEQCTVQPCYASL